MKAMVYENYGPPEVLQLKEVPKPVPGEDEVLVQIHATTVTSGDWRMRKADPPVTRLFAGLRKPRQQILGSELSGMVESVGTKVTLFKVGDAVFAGSDTRLGANAEYICLPESGAIALKPENMSFEEAAAVPFGATTALHFLRDKGHIRSGQRVLVYGASGAVGTFAVQLAGYFGATVTGVCSNANLDLVKSLGAGEVIDYVTQDFTQNGQTYDLIFDTVGKTSFRQCRNSLREGGTYLAGVGGPREFLQMLSTSIGGKKRVVAGMAIELKEHLILLKQAIEEGKVRSVIDRAYPFSRTAEAHAYVEQGHKRGCVVITVRSEPKT